MARANNKKLKKVLDRPEKLCYAVLDNKADASRSHLWNCVSTGSYPVYFRFGGNCFGESAGFGLRSVFLVKIFWRCLNIATKELQLNDDIRDREVRVVADNGEQMGIMSTADALKIAMQKNLDLVKIAPHAKPPVCKIMDYGKYRFEQQKREKEARKNQRVIEVKEVQLSLNIDTHDLETKVNHARKFLSAGNKVKVSIRFRGREMAHPERGIEIMEKFASYLTEVGVVEKPAKMESRTMLMFLAAKPAK